MRDPFECRDLHGNIRTGADRRRVPAHFRPVVDDVVASVEATTSGAAVFVYGSVATGQAIAGISDLDILTVGLAVDDAEHLADRLSTRHAARCRAIEIGAAQPAEFVGEHDEAYGNRVFLRHYCVPLCGPTTIVPAHDFAADRRAARGFNGDIDRHLAGWRRASALGEPPDKLSRRVARKTLLAVAALVSITDRTWTTDRITAAHRWSEIEPARSDDMSTLLAWSESLGPTPSADQIAAMIGSIATGIVDRFATDIGLWQNGPQAD